MLTDASCNTGRFARRAIIWNGYVLDAWNRFRTQSEGVPPHHSHDSRIGRVTADFRAPS